LAALRAARDIDQLAAALNAEGAVAPQRRFVTARAVMAVCTGGLEILDALEAASSNRAVAWALRFLGQEAGLDIGDSFTQRMVSQLVADAVLTQEQGDALKALALQPVIVTRDQVNAAMFNDDGTERA